MKIKAFFLAVTLLACTGANAQQINPITKAVLRGYQEILNENPKYYSLSACHSILQSVDV